MKRQKIIFLSALFILAFYSGAFSQKDKEQDKYKLRTLSEVTMLNHDSTEKILKEAKLEDKEDFIGIDLFYSRVRVQFTGKSRPLSSDHSDLVKLWGRLQNIDSKIIALYEEELLFKECDKEYWIPMQKKISETLLKKVKQNEMITLFVVHPGGRKASMTKDFDWLFLSTAFEN